MPKFLICKTIVMEENKMDFKTIIALGVMSLLMVWMLFNQPEQPQNSPETKTEIVENQVAHNQQITQETQPTNLGAFEYSLTAQQNAQSEFTELENHLLKVKIANKGGQITELLIKGQKDYLGNDLYLVKDGNSTFSLELPMNDNRLLQTKDLFFEPTLNGSTISMKLKSAENQYLEYVYTIRPDEFFMDFTIRSVGLQSVLNTQKSPRLNWALVAHRMEKSVTYEDRYTQLITQYEGDRIEKLSESSDDQATEKQVNWIAFKQHLFSSFLISDKPFASVEMISKQLAKEESPSQTATKAFSISTELALSSGELNETLHWYFGPSDYYTLQKYDQYDLEKSIPLGWGIFGWINKWFVIPVFSFLSDFMPVGVAIIILTIVVRLLMSPIQYKSYISQAKMKVLRPEIEEINAKFKEPMKRQQETMALYSKAGVNPMSGCIPALLQMPVFFALFSFFPSAFVLRQQGFAWAEDLASYDSVAHLPFNIPFYGNHISLFPILASIAIFIYMMMTTGQMQQPKQEGVPNMKFMMYLSPLLMLFFFNNYASGLSLYYFISNLITIFIMLAIKYWIIDEKKIHAQIQENKQKPKKESKFQRKMREMMEQAQAQQNQKK